MALKDWQEISTTETAEWERTKNKSLVVSYAGNDRYEVELKKYSKQYGTYRDALKSFNSKPEAMAYAKNYMRTH